MSHKINIDKVRTDSKFMEYLKSIEEHTDNIPYDCFRCAYREHSVNHCWYTMATNKVNKQNGFECNHFVDEDKIE